jgi:hypothetical protein
MVTCTGSQLTCDLQGTCALATCHAGVGAQTCQGTATCNLGDGCPTHAFIGEAVPTLSTWGIGLAALAMLGLAIWMIRRRRLITMRLH